MTNPAVTSEFWALSLTRTGIGACALGLDMSRRTVRHDWSLTQTDGLTTAPVNEVLATVARSLHELLSGTTELPLAIVIVTPQMATACFMTPNGHDEKVYFDLPLILSRRDIPDRYLDDPHLANIYRNSFLRRIRQIHPDFGITEPLGIHTIGSIVADALTHCPADTCIPLGVPNDFPNFDEELFETTYNALGLTPALCALRAQCGAPFGKIRRNLAQYLCAPQPDDINKLADVPVFHAGSAESAFAYACASNPLSRAVSIGRQTHALWTASRDARALYEIEIIEPNASPTSTPNAPQTQDEVEKMTRDALTMQINSALPLSVFPGPKPDLFGYGFYTPPLNILQTLQSVDGSVHIPMGCNGLQMLHASGNYHMIGMTAAHTRAHVARAFIESQIFALRDWAEATPNLNNGPIRLALNHALPPKIAQWTADCLATPVILMDDDAEILAASGAALALMRTLGVITHESPKIPASIIEPSPQAENYQIYYQLHCSLRDRIAI